MTDRNSSPSDVLSALPHRRPHRRSGKRAARPTTASAPRAKAAASAPRAKAAASAPRAKAAASAPPKAKTSSNGHATKPTPATKRLRQPAQPAGAPPSPRSRGSVPTTGADVIGTAVHAAAELAEIGLTAGARALRNTVARLPRP
ncbi:MAG: hypothetical protein ACXVH1_31200 [Solirubrobacteraceae bacterium]